MSHTDPLSHSGQPSLVSKLDYGCLAARDQHMVLPTFISFAKE